MTDERTAQRLRQEFAKCRQTKGFNKYPETLRDEGIAYARSRRKQGARCSQVAEELGVSIATVDAWAKRGSLDAAKVRAVNKPKRAPADDLSLVAVVVRPVPESGQRVLARLEVDFGDGTRLCATGIATEDLAQAIDALRRRA
jgi:hypothetical protein